MQALNQELTEDQSQPVKNETFGKNLSSSAIIGSGQKPQQVKQSQDIMIKTPVLNFNPQQ